MAFAGVLSQCQDRAARSDMTSHATCGALMSARCMRDHMLAEVRQHAQNLCKCKVQRRRLLLR